MQRQKPNGSGIDKKKLLILISETTMDLILQPNLIEDKEHG